MDIHPAMTLRQVVETLPSSAEEGSRKSMFCRENGKTFVAKFGYYNGRWERFTGSATSERGIEYNDWQPV